MDGTDSQSSLRPTEMKAQAFASSWYKLETSVALDTNAYTTGSKSEGLVQVIYQPFPMLYIRLLPHSMPYHRYLSRLKYLWPYMDFPLIQYHTWPFLLCAIYGLYKVMQHDSLPTQQSCVQHALEAIREAVGTVNGRLCKGGQQLAKVSGEALGVEVAVPVKLHITKVIVHHTCVCQDCLVHEHTHMHTYAQHSHIHRSAHQYVHLK